MNCIFKMKIVQPCRILKCVGVGGGDKESRSSGQHGQLTMDHGRNKVMHDLPTTSILYRKHIRILYGIDIGMKISKPPYFPMASILEIVVIDSFDLLISISSFQTMHFGIIYSCLRSVKQTKNEYNRKLSWFSGS